MNNRNEVFEYLIDQLRQQVNSNQCEDLAHEVLSLKDKLRDSSALVKELYETISELQADLATATWDVEAFKRSRKGAHTHEQSGCRKEDTQGCEHEVQSLKNQLRDASALVAELQSELQHQIDPAAGVYRWSTAHFDEKGKVFNVERGIKTEQSGCRKDDAQECKHEWQFYGVGFPCMCLKCGLKK